VNKDEAHEFPHGRSKVPQQQGWTPGTLGQIVRLEYGASLPESARLSGTIPVIGSAGIVGSHDKPLVKGPGIVVGRKGSIGKVTWVTTDFYPIDTTYYAVPIGDVDLRWAYHVLASSKLARLNRATGVPGLNRDDVHDHRLRIPPPLQQRAIATVLDSIDAAIEHTQALISATDTFGKSLIQELLTKGVRGWHSEWKQAPGIGAIPADWEVGTLGTACDVASGIAMAPTRIPAKNVWRYLTVAHVQAGHVSIADPRFIEASARERDALALITGDVLMVEGHAQVSQLGRAALVPEEASGFVFQNHLFRVRAKRSACDPRFIAAYVNGQSGRRYFASFGGTTSGLHTVSAANVRALPIPLPPISEQRRIADLVSAIEAARAAANEELQSRHAVKDRLARALLSGDVSAPWERDGRSEEKGIGSSKRT
jgi:type I restriction enzyme, S subunit